MSASISKTTDPVPWLPAAATRLILIRHAEVEIAYHRVFGGRIDMPLSARGHEQAIILANWLSSRKLDALYSSPMKRVQETLVPFLKNGAIKQVIINDLREVDFGDWTGHGFEAVLEKFGARASDWLEHIERGAIINGETGDQFRARIEPCVRDIVQRHAGKTIGIAAHGGVICMILSLITGLPLSRISLFNIAYTSVSQVVLHPHRVEFELVNFTPWRDLTR